MSRRNIGQEQSIKHLDGPLLICAGAGSGKTYTLSKRIGWAFSAGSAENGTDAYLTDISQMLLSTYTRKATGELKSRVRQTLKEIGRSDLAAQVDEAWIGTIHSICGRILREHTLAFGVNPDFGIASDVETESLLALSMNTALSENSSTRSTYPNLFATIQTNTIAEHIKTLIDTAGRELDGFDSFALAPLPSPVRLFQTILDATNAAAAELDAIKAKTPKSKSLSATNATALLLIDYLLEEAKNCADVTVEDLVRITEHAEEIGLPTRSRTADIKALATTIRAMHAELLLMKQRTVEQELLDLARNVYDRYTKLLDEQGLLDNNSLITRAIKGLRAHPDIAHAYQNQFRLVMIDEFQDTSKLQIQLIELICGRDKRHLCTVGDSQQSIYRFQGADVGTYLTHKQDMHTVGANEQHLIYNYRSHGDVLAYVRAICGTPGYFIEDFLDLEAETPGKDWHDASPRIQMMMTEYPTSGDERVSKSDAVRFEAERIAQYFESLTHAGHQLSEMTLLLSALTHAQTYAEAFRAHGMPCIIQGGRGFFGTPHIQSALCLLSALANPFDTAHLLSLFTSDILPMPVDDLLLLTTTVTEQGETIRQNLAKALIAFEPASEEVPGESQVDTPGEPQVDRLSNNKRSDQLSDQARFVIDVLKTAWDRRSTMGPVELFRDTLIASGWFDMLAAQGAPGLSKLADIHKLIDMMQSAYDDGVYGNSQMLEYMLGQEAASNEKPGAFSQSEAEYISIMSVHASKGLEFPIVAVAQCYDISSRSDGLLIHPYQEHNYVSLMSVSGVEASKLKSESVKEADALTSPLNWYLFAKEEEKTLEYQEKRRLFYVAITRASAGLLVSAVRGRTKTPTSDKASVLTDIERALFDSAANLTPVYDEAGELTYDEDGDVQFKEGAFPTLSCQVEYGGSAPLAYHYQLVSPEDITGLGAAREGADDVTAAGAETATARETAYRITAGASAAGAPVSGTSLTDGAAVAGDAVATGSRADVKRVARVAHNGSVLSESDETSPSTSPLSAERTLEITRRGFEPEQEYPTTRYVPPRNIFSYSSLASAVGHGDEETLPASATREVIAQSGFDEEVSINDLPMRAETADADKSTDFGSAFHMLCEWVVRRKFAVNPEEVNTRALALARQFGVKDTARLTRAWEAWSSSDLYSQVQTYAYTAPELGFQLALSGGVIEGSIDLFCAQAAPSALRPPRARVSDASVSNTSVSVNQQAANAAEAPASTRSQRAQTTEITDAHAVIIDYKTGGSPTETPEQLVIKHQLQAACYALATMRAGYTHVDAYFVRVEQLDRDGMPQIVHYAFDQAELDTLKERIDALRAQMLDSPSGS